MRSGKLLNNFIAGKKYSHDYDNKQSDRLKIIKKRKLVINQLFLCGEEDSNFHGLPRYHLKVVRLPVSPSPHKGIANVIVLHYSAAFPGFFKVILKVVPLPSS